MLAIRDNCIIWRVDVPRLCTAFMRLRRPCACREAGCQISHVREKRDWERIGRYEGKETKDCDTHNCQYAAMNGSENPTPTNPRYLARKAALLPKPNGRCYVPRSVSNRRVRCRRRVRTAGCAWSKCDARVARGTARRAAVACLTRRDMVQE